MTLVKVFCLPWLSFQDYHPWEQLVVVQLYSTLLAEEDLKLALTQVSFFSGGGGQLHWKRWWCNVPRREPPAGVDLGLASAGMDYAGTPEREGLERCLGDCGGTADGPAGPTATAPVKQGSSLGCNDAEAPILLEATDPIPPNMSFVELGGFRANIVPAIESAISCTYLAMRIQTGTSQQITLLDWLCFCCGTGCWKAHAPLLLLS